MMLSDLSDSDLDMFQRLATNFLDSPLDKLIKSEIDRKIKVTLTALQNKNTPLDDIRFHQGCLEQATCDTMIVKGLILSLGREIHKRRTETH